MGTLAPIARSVRAAVLLPLITYTVWLVISRRFWTPTGGQDWIALGISLALGAPFVWRLPWTTPRPSRVVMVYVALGAFVLSLYTWAFLELFYAGR